MDEILKKKTNGMIKNRYSFPTTDEMKKRLDELKRDQNIDVNEMLRRYAKKMIFSIDNSNDQKNKKSA